jgi:hypothetical protein
MSRIFDDREKDFEARYAHDEELRFKVTMRRDKLLGLWAAKKLGLAGDAAADYARTIVDKALERTGGGAMAEKLIADFKAKGLELSPHRIQRHLDELEAEAREQIMHEVKPDERSGL